MCVCVCVCVYLHTHSHTHTLVADEASGARNAQDVAQLCQEERHSGNTTSYCLDFLIASTEYDSFVQVYR
jgi:hypothetical protein